MKWIDSLAADGLVTTSSLSLEADKEFLLLNMMNDKNNNDGNIIFKYSISYDNSNWSEWKQIYDSEIFLVEKILNSNLYIKFKVIFKTNSLKNPPVLNNVQMVSQQVYKIINVGHMKCYPKIWITKKKSDGNIELSNLENKRTLKLSNLKKDEEVFIDCENEEIISSLPLTYRYDDHNDEFIELEIGDNFLYGKGDFDLDIKYEMQIIY